ncbi:MAG: helix-turn-helix domain-containing protein [Kiritimatiellia bacterium]|nr:helix-turn-helix domain-containing protein [Lentisphaerota bacterium]
MQKKSLPSRRTLNQVCRDYYRTFRLHACPVDLAGRPVASLRGVRPAPGLEAHFEATRHCLYEALHWGEPYVFYRVSGIISWVVAMVDGRDMAGGILGGEVLAHDGDPKEVIEELAAGGIDPVVARKHAGSLRVMPAADIREAARGLSRIFYQISGWQPMLLEENRLKASQQRQIAEAMDKHRQLGRPEYPVDKEGQLLALIKAGERNGARRVLNEMLGAMFLSSSDLVVLRARAIEMMGYLTRAAVEDSPGMAPLLEENHHWMRKLLLADEFETLAHVLMKALDGFMDGIYRHSRPGGSSRLEQALDFIAANYSAPLTLREVAAAVGLSVYRMGHILKQQTGRTFLQHLIRLRVNKAMQLLGQTDMSCLDIALAVGFCDQSYFTRQFRSLLGITPARYRRNRLGPNRIIH